MKFVFSVAQDNRNKDVIIMILNINNIPQSNTPLAESAASKRTVELHNIFSTEVLNNTRQAFEKMHNLKIIKTQDFEKVNTIITKIVTDKNENQPQQATPFENGA